MSNPLTNDDELQEAIGIRHWEAQRRRWTQPSGVAAGGTAARKDIAQVLEGANLSGIHTALMDGRPFKQPMPLSVVVRILLSGWVAEKLWPSESFRPPASE